MKKNILILFFCVSALSAHQQAVCAETDDTKEQAEFEAPDVSDQQVTQNVKAALQNDTSLVQAVSGVNFEVKDGVVILTGTVASLEEKKAIELKVSECSGVTQVDNKINLA